MDDPREERPDPQGDDPAKGDLNVGGAVTLANGSYCLHNLSISGGSVIRVDPLTGRQTRVSSGGLFFDPAGIAVSPSGGVYVVDNLAPNNDGGVIRVDPRTGAQTMISTNGKGGNLFDLPFGIAIDRDGSLVVANRVSPNDLAQCLLRGRVIRVDPSDGDQTLISESGNPLDLFDDLLSLPLGVAVDRAGRILTANECSGAGIVEVNPLSGAQSALPPIGAGVLVTPERIAFDPAGDLLVSDFSLGDGDGGIVKVRRATGAQTLLRAGGLFNHPLGIAAVVNHPPVAALSLDSPMVAAGRPVRFDGSRSRDPDGQRLVYEWDLDGDGSFELGSGTASAVSRAYPVDGRRTVRVRVDDPHGGSAVDQVSLRVDGSVPVITRLRMRARVLAAAARRPPAATSLRFRLSEAATVSILMERARAGRRTSAGACRLHAAHGRRCLRWSRARLVTRALEGGQNAIRVRARGLRPGRYRLGVSAVDLVGNRSQRRTLPLRIVRRHRS